MKPPVAKWRLESAAALVGTNLTDTTNPAFVYTATGMFNKCVTAPSSLTSGSLKCQFTLTDKGTISWWAKTNAWNIVDGKSISGNRWMFGEGTYPSFHCVHIPGGWQLSFGSSVANRKAWSGAISTFDVSASTWYYNTFTWSVTANSYALYLNAVSQTFPAPAVAGTPGTGVTIVTYIGHLGTEGYDGYIDDVVVFDYIQTVDEIKRTMNAERGCFNDD